MKSYSYPKKNFTKSVENKFPLYASGLLNYSNRIGNLTSQRNVGPLKEFFKEFEEQAAQYKEVEITLENWRKFYLNKKHNDKTGSEMLEIAVQKNIINIEKIKKVLEGVDEQMIREYIEDLMFDKTFIGMDIESIVAKAFAKSMKIKDPIIEKGDSDDEKKSIDMRVNGIPIQIKPTKYIYMKNTLQGYINKQVIWVYYDIYDEEVIIQYDETSAINLLNKDTK